MKSKEEKEEEEDKNAGDPLSETEGWKASGEGNTDKFYGQNGDYLTHTVEGKEMLFHSNDGGKTYYPVNEAAQNGYKVSDGSLRLPKDFNPETPGSVMRESGGVPGPDRGEFGGTGPARSPGGIQGGHSVDSAMNEFSTSPYGKGNAKYQSAMSTNLQRLSPGELNNFMGEAEAAALRNGYRPYEGGPLCIGCGMGDVARNRGWLK
jgi:hypothetical protein